MSGLGIAMFGTGGGGTTMTFDGQVDGAAGFGVLREDSSRRISRHGDISLCKFDKIDGGELYLYSA